MARGRAPEAPADYSVTNTSEQVVNFISVHSATAAQAVGGLRQLGHRGTCVETRPSVGYLVKAIPCLSDPEGAAIALNDSYFLLFGSVEQERETTTSHGRWRRTPTGQELQWSQELVADLYSRLSRSSRRGPRATETLRRRKSQATPGCNDGNRRPTPAHPPYSVGAGFLVV